MKFDVTVISVLRIVWPLWRFSPGFTVSEKFVNFSRVLKGNLEKTPSPQFIQTSKNFCLRCCTGGIQGGFGDQPSFWEPFLLGFFKKKSKTLLNFPIHTKKNSKPLEKFLDTPCCCTNPKNSSKRYSLEHRYIDVITTKSL